MDNQPPQEIAKEENAYFLNENKSTAILIALIFCKCIPAA
jgi:hypothetical protein